MSTDTSPETHEIEFTEQAIEEAKATMTAESVDPEQNGLRVMAREKNCDCGSMAYGLQIESDPAPNDEVIDQGGLQVYVDPDSYEHVAGATVDYITGPGRSGFVVDVSTEEKEGGCGCGGHHH
jgi:iron-sulfur cluster assembly accessory protein